MSTLRLDAIDDHLPDGQVPMQPASQDIWDRKYRLKTQQGEPLDADIDATYLRVAKALSDAELTAEKQQHWMERFTWALRRGAIPAGRIISNAGAQAHKPATSTINCTVSGTIEDSMDGILQKVHEAGLTLKAGCGIGYEFSTLRPRGAFVAGAGAHTSGPMSFMDIFDKMCFTVSSAGGRRGAQMGTFDVSHPDVREFIRAKREDGRLRQFNLSLLITDGFMQAVDQDADWPLLFPLSRQEAGGFDLADPARVQWRDWPTHRDYVVREDGQVACRVYGQIRARHLWDMIMVSTYDYAEPGFILIDRVNEMNNNWWCEDIRATNPCVTADTWVHTADGPRQVAELIGRGFQVRVEGQDHATTDAGFFRTARKPVLALQTREGYRLRLTADHRVRRVSSRTRWEVQSEWCEAGQLRPGDEVLLQDHRAAPHWPGALAHEQGYLLGLLVGDGTLNAEAAVLSVWSQAAVANGEPATPAPGVRALMGEALRCAKTLTHRADFTGWSEVSGRSEWRLKSVALRDLAQQLGMSPGGQTDHAGTGKALQRCLPWLPARPVRRRRQRAGKPGQGRIHPVGAV
jgi:ribonucleoside-diphosphate reductase alpha chain